MKILVPIDGSPYTKGTIEFIASRSTLIGTAPEVELLNVQLPLPVRAARAVGHNAAAEFHREEADRILKPAVEALKQAGLEAVAGCAVGNPAEQITMMADKHNADLVILGSHGHGFLAGLVFGSTVNGVLARTRHPVLVLRGPHSSAPPDGLRVGIAVDGSEYGEAAARYVIRHRELFGAAPKVVVLHVVPDMIGAMMPSMEGMALPAMSAEEIKAQQDRAFAEATGSVRKMLEGEGLKVDAVCLVGNPGDELPSYAEKKNLDVLVLGSHGYGAFRAAVLGSVAMRVAAHCTTPLLLIRET